MDLQHAEYLAQLPARYRRPSLDEHIVLCSQPVYPALTESESLAVQQIRLRARAGVRRPPCSPLPGRVGSAWLSVLLLLMLLRALLALLA